MAGSIGITTGAVSFNTLLASAKARIAAKLSVPVGSIRTVAAPNERLPQYLSEPGFLARVRQGVPGPATGGGRHDTRVSRIVDFFVLTQSLQDPGGRDDVAVAAHIAREEALVDALQDTPAPGETNETSIPITLKWVPGGEDVARQVRPDPGLLLSCLSYQFVYRQPLTVFQGTT